MAVDKDRMKDRGDLDTLMDTVLLTDKDGKIVHQGQFVVVPPVDGDDQTEDMGTATGELYNEYPN